mgnify:CR=1 FL=1
MKKKLLCITLLGIFSLGVMGVSFGLSDNNAFKGASISSSEAGNVYSSPTSGDTMLSTGGGLDFDINTGEYEISQQ